MEKHDVTTKKFDAIVEKAGKVDANYAAQIEGYCSLLGEYGKKFEAVCAMLQPEKLRLSPDKYREKLEGINTGYQNAKDTHEQEQSDYEAELYEIETVWYKKMLDKAEDYLIRSAECIVLGNFTDEVTVLGVGVQIVLGIFDLDLPCDIRDIIADIKNLAETDRVRWDLIGMLALDLIGLIPVIGALKYSDEVGTLFKNAGKVSAVAEGADGVGAVTRHADEAGAWLQGIKVFKYSDETAGTAASGEKLLKESQTVYESFADMMSPDDAAKYLDFLENGSKEGLTSAELAGVEKADVLLVSQKVKYEDVWDLRNAGDMLESGSNTVYSYDGVKQASEYLQSQGLPRAYRKQILESFDVETIKLQTAGESTYGLRFYGGNANAEGRYLFETFSPLTNRQNLALPYEWNNMTGIQQFQVRSGTTMITGTAAAQKSFGSQYIGGANQWYINNLEDLIKCR